MAEDRLTQLAAIGDDLDRRASALAENWREDASAEASHGPVILRIHKDEHFPWFESVRAHLKERFGDSSNELEGWDRIANGGQATINAAKDLEGNWYIAYATLYRNATAYLRRLPRAPRVESALPSGEDPRSPLEKSIAGLLASLSYLRRKGGIIGLMLVGAVVVGWFILTHAHEVREGLEALGVLPQHARP